MRSLILIIMTIFASAAVPAWADSDLIYTAKQNNVAVGGYDAVSFFSEAPLVGQDAHMFNYKGAVWRFSSAENLELFKATPEAYSPQYGGYCSWALAQGKLAKGSPKYWRVINGKLYLNYSRGVQKKMG